MFFTRSWLGFQSSHSRQCVGSTKTDFPVEACTHPLSVRRQGKTRECTSSFSCTLSCRLRSNGAVNIGYQSRIMALFCYLCVPKTSSVLIDGQNRITSARDDCAAKFLPRHISL